MKVTTEGERVIDLLWDVIAAKGFEKDTYFEMAARDIRGLPKLEGTVHVNMALVLKFMAQLPVQPGRVRAGADAPRRRPTTSSCSARGRPAAWARSASTTGAPPTTPFADVPNVARFREQAEGLCDAARPPRRRRGAAARPRTSCSPLGELFTLVVYGQLILEQAQLTGARPRRRSTRSSTCSCATSPPTRSTLHGQASSTEAQQAWALEHVRKPGRATPSASRRVWEQVEALAGAYEMAP